MGSHLLYKLVQNDVPVKAIYRHEHKLDLVQKVFAYHTNDYISLYNKIEWIKADITDVPSLQLVFPEVTHVYHCAALVSFEPNKYHLLRKVNIEGTANIVNLCIANKVKKLCYVSSIATIGHHLDSTQLITEETYWNQEEDNSVYAITKYGAEIEAWRGTQEGLDTVILNPGIIVGPGFWNAGGSSSLIKKLYKGMPYYTHGITGYVDVQDVVNIMIQLMASDIKKDRFIVVSENLSFKDFQNKITSALRVKSANKLASSTMLAIAWRLDWLRHVILGKRRRFSKQMAQSAQSITKYDNSKIKNALHYNFIPMEDAINRASRLFLDDLKKSE